MHQLMIMVAPNGARRSKADHPHLPLTPAELAKETRACAEAGAVALHLHVRAAEGRHSLSPDRYREAIGAIRAEVGETIPIQITTEAVGRFTPAEQMATVQALRPDFVSLSLRELIPDEAAVPAGADFLTWMQREQIAPQFILYEPDDLARFNQLRRRGAIPQAKPFLLFVLGRYAEPADVRPDDLLAFLDVREDDLPWMMCAFGPIEGACAAVAARLGGHVRVGFENNLHLADGTLAASNADLVRQIADVAPHLGRPLATPDDARRFLAETAE